MLKALFVLPGGGDPNFELYKKVYYIISHFSPRNEYENVEILSYPGHLSFSESNNDLEVQSSVESVINYFLDKENKKESYDVICRSYGCSVFMNILLDCNLQYVDKITFWGPSPYLNYYKVIMKDEEVGTEIGLEKGVRLSSKTFNSIAPIEIQLMKYKGTQTIRIGTGELDKHCKPIFLDFLNEYLDKDKRFVYQVIPGVGHEVDYPNEEYLKYLFGK